MQARGVVDGREDSAAWPDSQESCPRWLMPWIAPA